MLTDWSFLWTLTNLTDLVIPWHKTSPLTLPAMVPNFHKTVSHSTSGDICYICYGFRREDVSFIVWVFISFATSWLSHLSHEIKIDNAHISESPKGRSNRDGARKNRRATCLLTCIKYAYALGTRSTRVIEYVSGYISPKS